MTFIAVSLRSANYGNGSRVSPSLEDKNPGEPAEVRPEDDAEGHDSQIDRLKRKSNRSALDSG